MKSYGDFIFRGESRGYHMEIDKQMNDVLKVLTNELPEILVGIYLCGSSVQGGLKANSDLDFLVIVKEKLSQKCKQNLIEKLKSFSKKIGEDTHLRYVEISVIVQAQITPWSYPPTQDFIYGEWLRDAYHRGYIPLNEANPDLTILLYQAREVAKRLYGSYSLQEILPEIPFADVKLAMKESIAEIACDYEGDEQNAILTLCRIIQTCLTEKIYPKDIAGEIQAEHAPTQHQKLIISAVESYLGEKEINWKNYDVTETVNYLHKQALIYL